MDRSLELVLLLLLPLLGEEEEEEEEEEEGRLVGRCFSFEPSAAAFNSESAETSSIANRQEGGSTTFQLRPFRSNQRLEKLASDFMQHAGHGFLDSFS